MKKVFFFLLTTLMGSANAQVKSFFWTDSVDGEWQGEKVRTTIDTKVYFIGNYMCKSVCDFTYSWKCERSVKLYEYKDNHFEPLETKELFKDKGKELLSIANLKLQQSYNEGKGKVHDCFVGMDNPGAKEWNSFETGFSEEGFWLSYFFDAGGYCDAYNWSDTLIQWEKIKPMLTNPLVITPDFCTPSGPKVNIRSEESSKSEVLFQLDKGEFFEIISKGKEDKVNGKSGLWYMINYFGKTGYIFSFYTLCR